MTDHPITPPPELVQQWGTEFLYGPPTEPANSHAYIAYRAAQWGYDQRGEVNEAKLQQARDQELEACCRELEYNFMPDSGSLRAARRPKPPSLKKQALRAAHIEVDPQGKNGSLIIRALEALPDD